MKTVQQIMQETGAEANIRNFRYMQENYTYKQKIRHAENVARSYQDKCSEMGLNCHISVGGLDSITLHYFLEACGVHVPCVSCSSLEQKGVQRTGCTMCGFGIQLEQRPNRFDRLRSANPKEWEFWMRHVCRDDNGDWYGWGRVLDYIGVEWENEPGQLPGQMSIEDYQT